MNDIVSKIRPALPALLLSVAFLTATQCAKPVVPADELSKARAEVQMAEVEGAATHSAERFGEARSSLLAAHQALEEDKNSDARKHALDAFGHALAARSDTAPHLTAAKRGEVDTALAAADAAFAEELARNELASARSLRSEAEELEKEAQSGHEALSAKEKPTQEELSESITAFRSADAKYDEAKAAAQVASTTAIGQKGRLETRARTMRATLTTADRAGARQFFATDFTTLDRELSSAETEIRNNQLKSANSRLDSIESQIATLNTNTERRAAEEKQKEAATAIAQAEDRHTKAGGNAMDSSDIQDMLKRNEEYLAAGKESLSAAESKIRNQNYSDSLRDSNEAIRLAGLIQSQVDEVVEARRRAVQAAEATARDTKLPEPVKDVATTVETKGDVDDSELPEGWRRYEVEKRSPADCLWCISQRHYGTARLWRGLFNANRDRIDNPHLIQPGQQLVIPPKEDAERRDKEEREKGTR